MREMLKFPTSLAGFKEVMTPHKKGPRVMHAYNNKAAYIKKLTIPDFPFRLFKILPPSHYGFFSK